MKITKDISPNQTKVKHGIRVLEIEMPEILESTLDRFTYVSELIRMHEKFQMIKIESIDFFKSVRKNHQIKDYNISSKEILKSEKLCVYLSYNYRT